MIPPDSDISRNTAIRSSTSDYSDPVDSRRVPDFAINLLDFQRLNSISRRNRRFQRRLLQKVLAMAHQDQNQLLTELDNQNWPVIEITAHRLKGSSANVGAIAVHQVATDLEANAQSQNRRQCEDSLTLLKEKLVELDEFIGQHYPQSG
ncbi:Hpt domain-containing protein [Roseofilum sp. BLCC_M91]|uniref:Hpt domain-containing protein n=1 Tax=Roseofilum halophilum BLCC-M91 TaxID=3022259 RepID=A0ABT7BJC5_9CYAN|nr:Hpt domain-containing protein [Roseofilum halophilum]MDJ1179293.1 Hpt domain-containing protein [Roseofilum halophilum BLCC-M91]